MSELLPQCAANTPYGSGVIDLSNGPVVIELPPSKRDLQRNGSTAYSYRTSILDAAGQLRVATRGLARLATHSQCNEGGRG